MSELGHLPVLSTPRLLLRPRAPADLADCLAMDSDPEVTRFIDGPWSDPEAHRAFVEDRIRRAYPAGMGYWSIIIAGGFAGWVLLTPLDLHGPEIEIGWRMRRSVWGRGLATEAGRLVLDHALGRLGLAEVMADIDPANTPSLRVAAKLGMRVRGWVPYAGRMVLRHAAPNPRFIGRP